jgi:hypothetical protein
MIGSRTLAALTIGTTLLASPAWSAELVVVEARGLTLKPGQVVDDTQKLTLQRGDEVTLVDENGAVIKLRGPYDAAPSASSSGSGVDVSNVLAALSAGGSQSSMGVVRAKVENVTLPNPWVVDVTHSGKACVRAGTSVVFWRQQAAGAAKLRITPVDRTWRAESEWAAGAERAACAGDVPGHGPADLCVRPRRADRDGHAGANAGLARHRPHARRLDAAEKLPVANEGADHDVEVARAAARAAAARACPGCPSATLL